MRSTNHERAIPVRFPRRQHGFAIAPKIMKPKLLLVDDDASVREMVGRVLTGAGYSTLSAANGQEALDLVATNEVDLVLLDLNLPVKNGWDTFERLTTENPFVPIIIITARPNQLFPALAAGVGALMEKPLDFPRLLETIRGLLDEAMEERLARLAGKPAEFHYLPARPTEEAEE